MKNEGPNVFGQMPAVPKFLASLLLMLALSVTAAAQNRKISIDMQNVTVKEFFAEIEKRSDYTFAYNNSEIDLAARVSVRAVDDRTCEVRRVPGLYVVGEALDVDAACGGFNLHWAFGSGLAAGRSAAKPRRAVPSQKPPRKKKH